MKLRRSRKLLLIFSLKTPGGFALSCGGTPSSLAQELCFVEHTPPIFRFSKWVGVELIRLSMVTKVLPPPAYCALGGLGGVRSERRGMAGILRTPLVIQGEFWGPTEGDTHAQTRSRKRDYRRMDEAT